MAIPICPVCDKPTACDHPTVRAEAAAGEYDSGFERDYCPDCGEDLLTVDDEDAPMIHPDCCDHGSVDMDMDPIDPARESTTHGLCADCGSEVHLEYDPDEQTGFWARD